MSFVRDSCVHKKHATQIIYFPFNREIYLLSINSNYLDEHLLATNMD